VCRLAAIPPALEADKRDYDRAIQDLDHAISLDPNLALAFLNRGRAFSGKRDHDRAIQDYDQAIRLDPNLALAFNNRGDTYNDKREYDRGIQDLDHAISLGRSSSGSQPEPVIAS
jgi:tetratricopeptide (TPR) repeat protein